MPSSRSRPRRQLAVRRAARRRSGEPVPRTAHVLPQPLPPLVPPDDDREFVTSVLVPEPARALEPAV